MSEGFRRLGRVVTERFLASADGSALRESLPLLPAERAFGKVIPLLFGRLRQPLVVEWVAGQGGGVLRVRGHRALAPEITLGALQLVAESLSPPATLSLCELEPELLGLQVVAHGSDENGRPPEAERNEP